MSALTFFSTFKSKGQATAFAHKVTKQNLAKCVQVLPAIESHYFWRGKLCKDKEVLIIGKTTSSRFKKLKAQIKKLHPYEVPELIAFNIADGHKPYLDWLKSAK